MRGENSAVESLARALWDVRAASHGRIDSHAVMTWGRMLAEAVQMEARAQDGYSPEEDGRVLWMREVLAAARRREPRCLASGSLEANVAFLLELPEAVVGVCGKDRAAGEGWE